MKNAIVLLFVVSLSLSAPAEAKVVGFGDGGSMIERMYLGWLLGLAGVIPGVAVTFALLNAMFCHPARSKWLQALLGVVVGCMAYALCVVIGAFSLGPLLEPEHPLRQDVLDLLQPVAALGEEGFWGIAVALFFLPAVPLAVWSTWHAHSRPR